jgi:hypothetical protein
MRRTSRIGACLALVAGGSLALTTVAAADLPGGDNDVESGYSVEVEVNLSGDAAPDGGGYYSFYIPPLCYWGPFRGMADGPDHGDGTDMQKVLDYMEWAYNIPLSEGSGYWVPYYGSLSRYEEAVEREEDGEDLIWYSLYCNIHYGDERAIEFADGEYMGGALLTGLRVQGEEPEILIDPEDLAEAARDEMVIDEPDIDRNPQMAGANEGATLVNVPTWFWVTNPDSVGGPDGERSIRAEVVNGDVWAEVTAQTGGLSIGSPNGSAFCDPAVALIEWGDGVGDDDACTVSFSRASVSYPDGYPVTASTEWSATWEGVTQDGEEVGGDLEPLSRQADTVFVPVAEIQSIVRGLR